MSERIRVSIEVDVTVTDVEKLRIASAFKYQPGGVGEVHLILPDGDVHMLAAQFLASKVTDAMTDFTDVFEDYQVTAK